jgi:hypothetical protein
MINNFKDLNNKNDIKKFIKLLYNKNKKILRKKLKNIIKSKDNRR